MIRAYVLTSCPVYLVGMVHVLENGGIHAGAMCPLRDVGDRPDVLVVDADAVAVPDTLAGLRKAAGGAPVLVVNDGPAPRAEAFRAAGAVGVLGRWEDGERIVAAVRAVVAGPGEPSGRAAPLPQTLPDPVLSARETQVLQQIARGRTHGQIARGLEISPHTVDTYVRRIRTKLGVGNKAELTRAALRYALPPDVHGSPSPFPGTPRAAAPRIPS